MGTKAQALQYKALPLETEITDEGVVECYAAQFNNIDNCGDRVQPGAFNKTIPDRLPRKLIKVFHNHESWLGTIGTPLDLRPDSYGLFARWKFNDTDQARQTREEVRSGGMAHMSIGYVPVREQKTTIEGGREINDLLEVKLMEISPVYYPMNEGAEITGLKAFHRQIESATKFLVGHRPPAEESKELQQLVAGLAKAAMALGVTVPAVIEDAATPNDEPPVVTSAPDWLKHVPEIHAALAALHSETVLNNWRTL